MPTTPLATISSNDFLAASAAACFTNCLAAFFVNASPVSENASFAPPVAIAFKRPLEIPAPPPDKYVVGARAISRVKASAGLSTTWL